MARPQFKIDRGVLVIKGTLQVETGKKKCLSAVTADLFCRITLTLQVHKLSSYKSVARFQNTRPLYLHQCH